MFELVTIWEIICGDGVQLNSYISRVEYDIEKN